MISNPSISRRSIPLSVLAALALLAALLVSAVSGDNTANADSQQGAATTASAGHHVAGHHAHKGALTAKQAALHDKMRKLWEDHVTWTRLAIVTFASGSAGFDATAARLLQNQTDIGNAIKPFYGKRAGNHLGALLHDHITIAVEVLQAAKAGDTAALKDANARWYANANDIADFLASANPKAWPKKVMREAMRVHLDQTLTEAGHELTGDYTASVKDYEAVHRHILAMADTLSDGIIAAFPRRFR